MGGYGALALAVRYPDVFSAGASHSGVVAPMYIGPKPFVAPAKFASTLPELQTIAGAYGQRLLTYWGMGFERWRQADILQTAAALQKQRAAIPALFFDCGTEDGLVDQNRALHSELTRLGIAHSYAEWPGAHTWRYWSTHVRESLAWMGGRIGR